MISIKIDLYGKCFDTFKKYKEKTIGEKIKEIEKEIEKYDDKILEQLEYLLFDILNDRYYCKTFGIKYENPTTNDIVTLKLALLKSVKYK